MACEYDRNRKGARGRIVNNNAALDRDFAGFGEVSWLAATPGASR